MTQAKDGDTIRVHYTGKLEDGSVFDSTIEREPLKFTLGEGKIIPGFEKAVIGMEPGEKSKVKIPAEEAYGPYLEERVMEVNREEFPPELKPEMGQQLQVRQADDQTFLVRVTEIRQDTVILDANHPLAGEDLTFDIELVEIVPE